MATGDFERGVNLGLAVAKLEAGIEELAAKTAKSETKAKSGPKTVRSVFDDLDGIVNGTVTLAAGGAE